MLTLEIEDISIADLFGDFCSSSTFRHEKEMDVWRANRKEEPSTQQTHTTTTNSQSSPRNLSSSPVQTRTPNQGKLEGLPSYHSVLYSRPVNQEDRDVTPSNLGDRTPPRQILAVSPNSASQNLRRKAIHDQLQDGDVKRIRRSYNDSPSSPISERSQEAEKRTDDANEPTSSFGDVTLVASEVIVLDSSQNDPSPGEPVAVDSAESESEESFYEGPDWMGLVTMDMIQWIKFGDA